MKIYSSFYAMAAIAAVGFMSSCSSDEEIVAEDGNNVITNKTITAGFNVDENNNGSETRLGASINRKDATSAYFKAQIYSTDYFWVYAPDAKDDNGNTIGWFNKLAPNAGKGDFPTSTATFASVSNSTVKFVENSLVYALYSAMSDVKNQDAHALSASKFVSKDNSGNTILTFTRDASAKYDYDLAYVYGKNSSIPYTDENNPFSFKVASALINKDGYLLHFANDDKGNLTEKDEKGPINIVSYVPKIRFSIPAASNNDNEKAVYDKVIDETAKNNLTTYWNKRKTEIDGILSKLEYKIVVDAVPANATDGTTTGYPKGMTYRLLDKDNETDKKVIAEQKAIVPTGVTELGGEIKLYYGTNTTIKNTSLWNTAIPGINNKGNVSGFSDFCTGDVYIPLPPVKYKYLRVLVNVSCSDNELKNTVTDLCHTYKMEITDDNKLDFSFDINTPVDGNTNKGTKGIKDIVSAVYDLGSIWNRTDFITTTTNTSGNAPAKNAPAKAKAGNGWEIVDDAEFNF